MASTLKTLLDQVKTIKDPATAMSILQVVMELQEQLSHVKDELRDLQDESDREAKKQSLREELILEYNAYWFHDHLNYQPYCIGCFDKEGRLQTLARNDFGGPNKMTFSTGFCPSCKTEYLNVYRRPHPESGKPPPAI